MLEPAIALFAPEPFRRQTMSDAEQGYFTAVRPVSLNDIQIEKYRPHK